MKINFNFIRRKGENTPCKKLKVSKKYKKVVV